MDGFKSREGGSCGAGLVRRLRRCFLLLVLSGNPLDGITAPPLWTILVSDEEEEPTTMVWNQAGDGIPELVLATRC